MKRLIFFSIFLSYLCIHASTLGETDTIQKVHTQFKITEFNPFTQITAVFLWANAPLSTLLQIEAEAGINIKEFPIHCFAIPNSLSRRCISNFSGNTPPFLFFKTVNIFPFNRTSETIYIFGSPGQLLIKNYISQSLGSLGYLIPLFFFGPSLLNKNNLYFKTSTMLIPCFIMTGQLAGKAIATRYFIASGCGPLFYSIGFLCTLTGFGIPLILHSLDSDIHVSTSTHLASTLLGYGIGTGSVILLNPDGRISFDQSIGLSTSILSGITIAMVIPLFKNSNNAQDFITAGIIGGWVGFFSGYAVIRKYEKKFQFSRNKPDVVSLSIPALINLQIAAVAKKFNFDDFKISLVEFSWKF